MMKCVEDQQGSEGEEISGWGKGVSLGKKNLLASFLRDTV
jgi:hypothetical protein